MKDLIRTIVIAVASILIGINFTFAAAPTDEASADKYIKDLHFQVGKITLGDDIATLNIPPGYRYLNAAQADKFLTDIWGNPPGDPSLGMIFPSEVDLLSEESWGVVITFSEDGYVKDDEAESINYDDLLKDMKEGTHEDSLQRVKQGYNSIELLNWAEQPHYDKQNHKLYWAQELDFGGQPVHSLNYNIRALGRRGVLVLNAVAGMNQLPMVKRDMQKILGFVEFNDGHKYSDFNPSMDKVAAYGIGALIAGKIAAKAGFFKLIIAFLIAAKKAVALVVIAILGFIKSLFGKGKNKPVVASGPSSGTGTTPNSWQK